MHAGNSESLVGSAFILVPVTVRGELSINLNYTTPAVSDASAKAFLEGVTEDLVDSNRP